MNTSYSFGTRQILAARRVNIARLLLVDTSASMNTPGKLPRLKPVLKSMIRNSKYFAQDLVAMMSFDSAVRLHCPFVPVRSAGPAWNAAIDALCANGRATNLASALYSAIGRMGEASGFAKEIILLTDGVSTEPRELVLQRVVAARQYRIRITVVGFGDPGELDVEELRYLASRTGGRFYLAQTADRAAQVLAA